MDYRDNVGICVLNKRGEVFVGLRAGYADAAGNWQMPQGGIDDGELPMVAAVRELVEETGILAHEVEPLGEYPRWLTYDFPAEVQAKMGSLGQKQKWFYFRYVGAGNIDVTAAQDQEFDAWKWAAPEVVLAEVVDFKWNVYEAVLGFAKLLT